MEFSHQFKVAAQIDDVWALMSDLERVAPCLPGAQLQEVEGDDYHGIVKVKVGPISAQYKGTAKLESVDESARKLAIAASARDVKGAGNARATIAVALTEAPGQGATEVSVDVDLNVSGKVAQFGRGVLADVNTKLMEKFAQNLSEMIATANTGAAATADAVTAAAGSAATAAADAASGVASSSPSSGAANGAGSAASSPPADQTDESDPSQRRTIDAPEAEAVDLLETTGAGKFKAAVAVMVGSLVALALLIRRKLKRRKPNS